MLFDQLSAAQLDSIVRSTSRLNVWVGPVRSGKTIGSLLRFIEFCFDGPEGMVVVVGKTHDTVKFNVIEPLIEILGPYAVRYNRGLGELQIGPRTCRVVGAPTAIAEQKLRGMTLAGAYVDEITIIDEGFWRMLLSRLSVPGAKLFGTTNPDRPGHWFRKDYLQRAGDLDMAVFDNFRLEDNPGLTEEFIGNIKAEYGPPGTVWYQRYVLGRWVLAEGLIWSAFNRSRHLASVPATGSSTWYMAIDYGTTNPLAAVLARDTGDALHIVREWRWDSRVEHRQLTDGEYSQRLRDWLRTGADGASTVPIEPRWVFVDPSAASFGLQLSNDGLRGVAGADNSVADGLREVNSLFGADRLRIHPSCEALVEEIEGYVWDPKALARGVEQPLKERDHSADATRYLVRGTRNVWHRWVRATAA